MPLNRVVALATPTLATPIFSTVGAVVAGYAAKYAPGLHITATQVTSVEVVAAVSGAAAALKWLHGHQQFERLEHEAETEAMYVATQLEKGVGAVALTATPDDPEAAEKAKRTAINAAKAEAEKLIADARVQAQKLVEGAASTIQAQAPKPVATIVPAPQA
jgi:hypothetical protein